MTRAYPPASSMAPATVLTVGVEPALPVPGAYAVSEKVPPPPPVNVKLTVPESAVGPDESEHEMRAVRNAAATVARARVFIQPPSSNPSHRKRPAERRRATVLAQGPELTSVFYHK